MSERMTVFASLGILDDQEAREVAAAVRAEAERRWPELPVEKYAGWKDAADWIEGVEDPRP
jgi:hypothetical protein